MTYEAAVWAARHVCCLWTSPPTTYPPPHLLETAVDEDQGNVVIEVGVREVKDSGAHCSVTKSLPSDLIWFLYAAFLLAMVGTDGKTTLERTYGFLSSVWHKMVQVSYPSWRVQ